MLTCLLLHRSSFWCYIAIKMEAVSLTLNHWRDIKMGGGSGFIKKAKRKHQNTSFDHFAWSIARDSGYKKEKKTHSLHKMELCINTVEKESHWLQWVSFVSTCKKSFNGIWCQFCPISSIVAKCRFQKVMELRLTKKGANDPYTSEQVMTSRWPFPSL